MFVVYCISLTRNASFFENKLRRRNVTTMLEAKNHGAKKRNEKERLLTISKTNQSSYVGIMATVSSGGPND